jgi:hypothetical protein
MTRFLPWSLRTYRLLLLLYPDDLRRDFGSEMFEAFADDLSVECAARGVKGAIRIWRITLCEVIRIGFPAWLQIPAIAVPALSAATVFVSQSPLLGDTTPLDALVGLAIGAAVSALTSFVAVYRWKRAGIISLGICSKRAI